MMCKSWAAFFLAIPLLAQPKFDVVSIRAVPANAEPLMREQDFTPILPGGQFVDSRASLLFMIAIAYEVKFPALQLSGLPGWARNQSFAVAAKPAAGFPALAPAENVEQVRLMMRAMLAERFHLQLRTETRQAPVFTLKTAKGGFKIEEAAPPVPPAKEGYVNGAVGNSSGRFIGKKSTLAGFAVALTIFLKQPVIDQTGLKGYYDFDVKWRAPEGAEAGPGLGADGIGLMLSALRDEFGLQLTKTTGPVTYWVVEHVEPPTDN